VVLYLSELRLIHQTLFRLLGTPNEEVWPGVSQLPDYKESFPQWSAVELAQTVRGIDSQGLDLIAVSDFTLNNPDPPF
jgi:hypothetical protein